MVKTTLENFLTLSIKYIIASQYVFHQYTSSIKIFYMFFAFFSSTRVTVSTACFIK